MKEFFFLAGMQRSGATIISQVLNQNPNIWVSPASPLWQMMKHVHEMHGAPEYVDYPRPQAMLETLYHMPRAFYHDKQAKYIIDKNLNWPSPIGVEMAAKYIANKVKIICPVRNILDILVSFDTVISANPESKNNLIDRNVILETAANRPLADRRADWLMQEGRDISACLNHMRHALIPEYRHIFHFVEYDDFINDPEKEIAKIYAFLEIESFPHKFEDIEDVSGISQDSITGIRDLHKIRGEISKTSRKPESVFLPETIKRYSGLECWRAVN